VSKELTRIRLLSIQKVLSEAFGEKFTSSTINKKLREMENEELYSSLVSKNWLSTNQVLEYAECIDVYGLTKDTLEYQLRVLESKDLVERRQETKGKNVYNYKLTRGKEMINYWRLKK